MLSKSLSPGVAEQLSVKCKKYLKIKAEKRSSYAENSVIVRTCEGYNELLLGARMQQFDKGFFN